MTKYDKDDERIQNDEEEETQFSSEPTTSTSLSLAAAQTPTSPISAAGQASTIEDSFKLLLPYDSFSSEPTPSTSLTLAASQTRTSPISAAGQAPTIEDSFKLPLRYDSEPLLGAKPQAATIVSGSQGALKMGGSVVATPAPAPASGDIITQLVGEKGWWQLRTTMIVYLTKIPAAWFMACIIFTAPAPWEGQYECQLSDGSPANISQHPSQITADGSFVPDRCLLYSSNIINLTQSTEEKLKSFLITSLNPSLADEPTFPCEQFSFNLDYRTTLITQFDLVCTKAILVAITQCFHLMGVLIGGVIATEAMETCRPRRVMMLGLILQIVVGIATGYMPLFWLHVAARCAVAACCALTFTSGAVIMADIWGGRYKTMVSANFENMWAIGVILLPAIGYFTETWAQIYITISLPLTVVIMILWWWIPDPPRWHLERSDVKTAQEILENAVLVNNNGTSIPDNLHDLLKIEAHDLIGKRAVVSKSEWRHLLSMKGAWWRVLFVVTSWSLMFTCYYGCLLNIRGFGRQYLYVNTAIAGAAELLGGLLGFFILMKTKHKWSCVGVLTGFTGILNCTIWFFPTHIDGSHFLYDLMTIAMINKVGISASLCVLTTCTAELFPLPHKKRVVYASTVCARIIFMTAPLIGFTNIFGDGVSLSSFGVLTVISGMATMLLNPLKVQQKENATTNVWTVKIDSNEQTKM